MVLLQSSLTGLVDNTKYAGVKAHQPSAKSLATLDTPALV